jgi:hypothetical protein
MKEGKWRDNDDARNPPATIRPERKLTTCYVLQMLMLRRCIDVEDSTQSLNSGTREYMTQNPRAMATPGGS